jgi:predicted ATPase/class 3 adenylate cyclase
VKVARTDGVGLPTGTVTFVFTDIEGSTRLVRDLGSGYHQLLATHHAILRDAFREHRGYEVRTAGDSFFVAFRSAPEAVAGVVQAQRVLAAQAWPGGAAVRVRMGVHTGEGPAAADDYGGLDVNRAARIAAAAHGGQVIISDATRSLLEPRLPIGVELRDLGEHKLRDLDRPERLFQLLIGGLQRDFPAIRSQSAVTGNLPLEATSFVGRSRELVELTAILSDDVRLLTLAGPGGTGKTRLAIELAHSVQANFVDGVFFVPLAAVTNPTLVPTAIAHSLHLRELGAQPLQDQLIEHLGSRRILLVLDNLEHLLGATPIIQELLTAAPTIRVLVTSRVTTHIPGEQLYSVEPLPLAPKASTSLNEIGTAESVKLFVSRAGMVSREFRLTQANARTVADLCSRLDGLPLAIELAAARTRTLPPSAILRRIDKRLDSLIAGGSALPPRQRTLRATIAWSHDLLDAAERRLFARLSVFAGGARLDDVEAVCGPPADLGGDVAALVSTLVDHNLLRPLAGDGEPRFDMLETIREFATERLADSGEGETIRDRHVARFAELARLAEPELMGSSPTEWLERLEREHDNVSAVLDRVIAAGPSDIAVTMPAMLWRSWQMSGRLAEGRRRTEQALVVASGNDDPEARRLLLEAAGGVAYWQGDFDTAGDHYEAQLELARETGRADLIAGALYNLAFARSHAFQGGDPTFEGWRRGVEMLEEGLRLYDGLGQRAGRAKVLWGLGEAARTSGDLVGAGPLIEECLAVFRELGDEFHTGWALRSLADLRREQGDATGATAASIEGLVLFHGRRDVTGVLFFLGILARLALDEGQIERGLALVGATRGLRVSSGAGLVEAGFPFAGPAWDAEIERMGPAARGYLASGEGMTVDDAVSYAQQSS